MATKTDKQTVTIESNSRLQRNRWYTITLSFSQGYALMYINGVLDVANDVSPYQLATNEHNLIIGPD